MQGSLQEGSSSMTLDSTREYLAEQTLQAGESALYVPRRKDLARPAAAALPGGRRLGAFAMPKPKTQTSKTLAADVEGQRQAKLAENRRAVQDRTKQDRAKRVTMARNYRAGEIPDIQIPLEDVVKPLQALALKDSIVSKLMLDLLFKAILSLPSLTKEETDGMKKDVHRDMLTMLGLGWSSDLIGALLKLAETLQLRIPSNIISKVCVCVCVCLSVCLCVCVGMSDVCMPDVCIYVYIRIAVSEVLVLLAKVLVRQPQGWD